jgi:2'-5' RNA ligase
MVRAFVAVKISDQQRQAIASILEELSQLDVRVKWVAPENLHITLKFLGDTDEEILPQIYKSIENAIGDSLSFDFLLEGVGQFPNARNPRVIWAGIREGYESLRALSSRIDQAVRPFGFKPEKRRFSAHLTIGRVKDNRNINILMNEISVIDFVSESSLVTEVVLYQSTLRPKGPIYTPLKTFDLLSTQGG